MKKALKIILIVILVFLILIATGFAYLYFNGMSGMSRSGEAEDGQTRVACVGDSITYGHGITNWPKNNYPTLLAGLLGDSFHVESFGVSGRAVQTDADQPYTALEHYRKSLAYDADILVFMMGTNDSKPENWHGEDAFREDLLSLLDSYGDAQIILCTPSTAYFTDDSTGTLTSHDIQPEVVDTIAELIREVAAERGYPLLDIHALTAAHPEWFVKDGVHPNNDGAAAIAQAVSQAINDLVTEQN